MQVALHAALLATTSAQRLCPGFLGSYWYRTTFPQTGPQATLSLPPLSYTQLVPPVLARNETVLSIGSFNDAVPFPEGWAATSQHHGAHLLPPSGLLPSPVCNVRSLQMGLCVCQILIWLPLRSA